MSIYIDGASRVIIQGITGKIGSVFAERMAPHYPNFVGGVTPGKGGREVHGRPVFNSVEEAVRATKANVSIISVAAPFVQDAAYEAIDAGIKTIWVYTDGIPVHQTIAMLQYAKLNDVTFIGPNSAGIVSPGKANAAELSEIQIPLKTGNIGVLSKSGSLCYEAVGEMVLAGYGFSTILCIGGDPIVGTTMRDAMEEFRKDPETKAIVLLGEIGGTAETDCIDVIKTMDKPVVAYICGHCAPPEKKMGHAGAIVSGDTDTAPAKTRALAAAGVTTVNSVEEIMDALRLCFKGID